MANSKADEREYQYPVFATQGGGLVREVNGKFIFVTDPDCPGLHIGDEMPVEWDYQPANQLARSQIEREEFSQDDDSHWGQIRSDYLDHIGSQQTILMRF